MKTTIRKWYWMWNFEKEEKWLNEMSAKGLALVSVGFCKYVFEDCSPGAYKYRLEFLNDKAACAQSRQYIKFIEDTGAEYVGSVLRWAYFKSKSENGEFNLYSDNSSRISYLNRLLTLLFVIFGMNFSIGLNNIMLHSKNAIGINRFLGTLNLVFALIIAYGIIVLYLKKRKIKKQQNLFE